MTRSKHVSLPATRSWCTISNADTALPLVVGGTSVFGDMKFTTGAGGGASPRSGDRTRIPFLFSTDRWAQGRLRRPDRLDPHTAGLGSQASAGPCSAPIRSCHGPFGCGRRLR
jgi:hypothetical protein